MNKLGATRYISDGDLDCNAAPPPPPISMLPRNQKKKIFNPIVQTAPLNIEDGGAGGHWYLRTCPSLRGNTGPRCSLIDSAYRIVEAL